MNIRYIIGGLIVVVFIVWGATAFMKTTIQYVSIAEAKTATHNVQVIGKIDFEAVNYNTDDSRLEFAIYDIESDQPTTAERMNVVYYGVVPGNFDQATSVVLVGKPDQDSFVADKMLVKCPSKYQGEGGEFQDMKKHEEAQGSGV
ncbi:MAG: cytochrome c maturation protein CcmE [bacterium]